MPYNGPRARPSPTKVRDTQRSKVYAAEGAIPTGQRFKDVPEMQAYVDKFLASAWARRRWGNRHVEVNPGFGHRRATGGNGMVQMPVWARDEKTLLHEVGHNLAGADAWHDPRFVRVMVEIVGYVFGKDALEVFRKAIKEERVKVGPALKLRTAERTPPAPVVLVQKLWRVEYKQKGETKTAEINASSMVSALARFVTLQQRTPGDGEITNLRAWRGVRQTARTPVKRAAKRPPTPGATITQVRNRAAELGATVDGDNVDAPRGYEWADDRIHSLVIGLSGSRREANGDVLARMARGLVPCAEDCEG